MSIDFRTVVVKIRDALKEGHVNIPLNIADLALAAQGVERVDEGGAPYRLAPVGPVAQREDFTLQREGNELEKLAIEASVVALRLKFGSVSFAGFLVACCYIWG